MATGETQAATRRELYLSLVAAYPTSSSRLQIRGVTDAHDLDLVFLGLPHGASQELVPELDPGIPDRRPGRRLPAADAGLYPTWYGDEHTSPSCWASSSTACPSWSGELAGAASCRHARCYVTTARPGPGALVRAGLIEPAGIVVDAARGCPAPARAQAVHLVRHRGRGLRRLRPARPPPHTGDRAEPHPRGGAVNVLFNPHLAPMNRGIPATCYACPTSAGITTDDLLGAGRRLRRRAVRVVTRRPPSTKATLGSNTAPRECAWRRRPTGCVVALGAMDNLTKGAWRAVQPANPASRPPRDPGLASRLPRHERAERAN